MEQSTLDYLDKFIAPGSLVLEIGDSGGGYTVELARRASTGGHVICFAADMGVANDVELAMRYRDVGDTRPNAEVMCVDIALNSERRLDNLALPDLHFVKIGPMYDTYTVVNGMKAHLARYRPIVLFSTPKTKPDWMHEQVAVILRLLGYKLYVLNDGSLLELPGSQFPRKETLAVYAGE